MPQLPPVRRFVSDTGVRIYRIACDVLPNISGRVYLLLGAGPPTLVDAGSGEGRSTDQILAGLQSVSTDFGEPFAPHQIERILITHAHIDHIGGLADLVMLTGAKVGVHALDCRVVTAWDERATLFQREMETFLDRAGVPKERQARLIEVFGFTAGRVRSVPVDFFLNEAEPLDGLRVIHTPGHSPGHVCIRVGDILLAGDHILAQTLPQQWPECLLCYTGLGHYLESLEKPSLREGVGIILGGHEPPIRSPSDRIREIRATHQRRLDRLLGVVGRSPHPLTIAQLARQMYSRQDGFFEFLALMDTGARVEYLEQRGCLALANLEELRTNPRAAVRYRLAKAEVPEPGYRVQLRGTPA